MVLATPASAAPVRSVADPVISSTDQAYKAGRYIVVLERTPAAAYDGGVSGFARTSPRGDASFDETTPEAERYAGFLRSEQQRLAGDVGARPYYSYTNALNGFAADLSGSQAAALAKRPAVLAVVPDRVRQLDTVNTPSFLGLTGPVGVWRRLGGSSSTNGAGRGQVVGIIDSGINSDSTSFRAVGSPAPADWEGVCRSGNYKPADPGYFTCNDKLIGGRFYAAGARAAGGIGEDDFLSPEDNEGHGSHTASTAAGDSGTRMVVEGNDFGLGSGMAPAAKVASYKVCWEAGCFNSDSVAAIDDATGDGVDVLNFSISGSVDDVIDPVEIAFMYAADANVFVAASAGNSGPDPSTVAHPSPWLTTVAAATHIRYEGTVVLGNGAEYVGASTAQESVPESPLVLARDSKKATASETQAQPCSYDDPATPTVENSNPLDSTEVDGAIVVCDRGFNARTEKSAVVKEAGGVGMILVNTSPNTVNADIHSVPTVHLDVADRAPIYAYAENAGNPTAQILPGGDGSSAPTPPAIAGFSSRGPSLAAEGDLLKPDITAPGVDVLAAVAPEGNAGHEFDIYSGTSMSSPHIAGLAALIQQKYPGWSPMQVKSAMMTTAGNLTDTSDPFDQGAGFVAPRRFLDPGLTFDSNFDDWQDYLSGQGVTVGGEPLTDSPMRASNLNLPSIAVGKVAGKSRVFRTVTNVDDTTSTYTVRQQGLAGMTVTSNPATFTLRPGESQTVALKLKRTGAPLDEWTKGNVVMTDGRGGHTVRVPIVAKPVGIDAPGEVIVDGGSFTIRTQSGVEGQIAGFVRGLVTGVRTPGTAQNTDQAPFDPEDPRNYEQPFQIAAKAQALRLRILPDFAADDLDLFLVNSDDEVVAASAAGGSDEQITVSGLPRGVYTAYVQAWAVHDGPDPGNESEPTTSFTLESFDSGREDLGNLTLEPRKQAAEVGERLTWQATTRGLTGGEYFGVITWRQAIPSERDPILGRTLVTVER